MQTSVSSTPTEVLFLGPEGTYSHQAALQQFGDNSAVTYLPADSIPQCFERLENERAITYSVVPLENSTNGQVVFSYDLLRDQMMRSQSKIVESNRVIPTLEVIGEQYVAITHCLISATELTLDALSRYKKIRLYSHPQVWGQVSTYLDKLMKRCPDTVFEKVDTTSTSQAVLEAIKANAISKGESILNLAIGSEVAAKLYKVPILDHGINDKLGNTTRFLVFKRRNDNGGVSANNQKKVSLITFTIKQDDPGALVDILTVLKDYKVNMCSINSRPFNYGLNDRKWQYIFFIEYYHDEDRKNWDAFYDDIGSLCLQWCLWGTFPRNQKYYE